MLRRVHNSGRASHVTELRSVGIAGGDCTHGPHGVCLAGQVNNRGNRRNRQHQSVRAETLTHACAYSPAKSLCNQPASLPGDPPPPLTSCHYHMSSPALPNSQSYQFIVIGGNAAFQAHMVHTKNLLFSLGTCPGNQYPFIYISRSTVRARHIMVLGSPRSGTSCARVAVPLLRREAPASRRDQRHRRWRQRARPCHRVCDSRL